MYRYHAYGLVIQSELVMPELVPVEAAHNDKDALADINIAIWQGDEPLGADAGRDDSYLQAFPDGVLLAIPGVARYWIGGSEIVVDPCGKIDTDSVRLFLMNYAISLWLWRDGSLVLHGSAVALDEQVWLFLGGSGSGKSTISAQLINQGATLIADEICRIHWPGGMPMIGAAYPCLQLWEKDVQQLGMFSRSLKPVRAGIKRYYVPVDRFQSLQKRVAGVVCLNGSQGPDGFARLEGAGKIQNILAHCHRRQFLSEMGVSQAAFVGCGQLAQQVPVWQCGGMFPLSEFKALAFSGAGPRVAEL